MHEPPELPDYVEHRPAKKMKLEGSMSHTEETREEMLDNEDGWDDIYGDTHNGNQELHLEQGAAEVEQIVGGTQIPTADVSSHASEHVSQKPVRASSPDGVTGAAEDSLHSGDAIESTMIARDEELVDERPVHIDGLDGPSTQMLDETSTLNGQTAEIGDAAVSTAPTDGHSEPAQGTQGVLAPSFDMVDTRNGETEKSREIPANQKKSTEDPEFMSAAAAQKGATNSEWQFDSSDAESSSDDTSSDSDSSDEDSDADSDGGYALLDPATAAKMLMSGDGDDEDTGGKGKGQTDGDHQPRTANEAKEAAPAKPDIEITAEMAITSLGRVEGVVENAVLIKGNNSGEYQVLEPGSVLCTPNRQVVGAISDTFGRVQEPMYSVRLSSDDVQELGLEYGTEVCYLNTHSTFVFTQPLRGMKGTDASNIHDEEVGEDEIEFSDDEKEAEFKRQRKLAKKAGRGGLSRGAFNEAERYGGRTFGPQTFDAGRNGPAGGNTDAPGTSYGGGMDYDDNGGMDEFYSPLKRPDNLSEMMAAPGRSNTSDNVRARGRGDRGRGRGRGEFNRGRGGARGGNDRSFQRGGHNADRTGFKGNANSFPDSHNADLGPRRQSPPHNAGPIPSVPPSQGTYQPGTYQPQPGQYSGQQQNQQDYQFNGYTFQYGNPPQPQQTYGGTQYAQQPPVPAGAFVNPAFFANQQQHQQQQQQQQSQQAQWSQAQAAWAQQYGTQQGAQAQWQQAYQQPYSAQGPLAQSQNLADVLQRLGQGAPPSR